MKKQLFILHEFYTLFLLLYGVSQITPGLFPTGQADIHNPLRSLPALVNIQIQQLRKQEEDMRKNTGGCRIPVLLL